MASLVADEQRLRQNASQSNSGAACEVLPAAYAFVLSLRGLHGQIVVQQLACLRELGHVSASARPSSDPSRQPVCSPLVPKTACATAHRQGYKVECDKITSSQHQPEGDDRESTTEANLYGRHNSCPNQDWPTNRPCSCQEWQ